VTYPPNSSPGAPDEAWTTPARPPLPVTTPIVPTHQVAGTDAIYTGGDSDPGGEDPVSATVAASVAAAMGRRGELQGDTYGQGSVIGDLMSLPPVVSDMSKHTGSPGAAGSGPAG
jgi:hypothetical protein